jgi:hypothetical protein
VFLAPSAAYWDDEVRQTAWLLPWTLAILGTARPRRDCEPATRNGWILVGTITILSGIMLWASAIVDGLKGLAA